MARTQLSFSLLKPVTPVSTTKKKKKRRIGISRLVAFQKIFRSSSATFQNFSKITPRFWFEGAFLIWRQKFSRCICINFFQNFQIFCEIPSCQISSKLNIFHSFKFLNITPKFCRKCPNISRKLLKERALLTPPLNNLCHGMGNGPALIKTKYQNALWAKPDWSTYP